MKKFLADVAVESNPVGRVAASVGAGDSDYDARQDEYRCESDYQPRQSARRSEPQRETSGYFCDIAVCDEESCRQRYGDVREVVETGGEGTE